MRSVPYAGVHDGLYHTEYNNNTGEYSKAAGGGDSGGGVCGGGEGDSRGHGEEGDCYEHYINQM